MKSARPANSRFNRESEREAKISRLKEDAPSLAKNDRRSSAKSMTGAMFALVGVMAVYFLMDSLDRVDDLPPAGNLVEVDTLPEAPFSDLMRTLARLEAEQAAGAPSPDPLADPVEDTPDFELFPVEPIEMDGFLNAPPPLPVQPARVIPSARDLEAIFPPPLPELPPEE
ncbi:MAG: hypothetical protein JJT96_11000 [Opitutales bacterium]|nr:hypothetical protein [Opitutales bacterium]